MVEIKRILCPIDFSEASAHAAAHAVAIARWFGSSITALHVYNPVFLPVPGLTIAGYRGEPTLEPAEKDDFMRRLIDAVPGMPEGRAPAAQVAIGPPPIEIVRAAGALPADLIVMGSHGATGFEYLVLGSVTEHVLRHARCPVLIVPPRVHATSALPFTRLVVAVDFSDWSIVALETAWRLAQEANARVTLVHAIEWDADRELRAAAHAATPEAPDPIAAAIRSRLCGLVPDAVREWCQPEVRVVRGQPFRAILQIADDVRADLIVMGLHGRSPVNLAIFGSTTNQVVRRATCPVLTVRG